MSVVTFDHLGYGFSDKPSQGYTYSLMDQADNAITLWRKLGIAKAHIVSHDMGDSVMTEILTRKMNGQLPDYFKDFFQVKSDHEKNEAKGRLGFSSIFSPSLSPMEV